MEQSVCTMANDNDNEWYFKYIEGVQCLCWKVEPQNEKERTGRRKLKEKLGKQHKDTLMIDTKQGQSSSEREICDIIFTTDNIEQWEDQFNNFYKSKQYTKVSSYINGGFQHAWKNDGVTVITMNFYKKRIMVQPGQQEEKNMLQFIGDFKEVQDITQPKSVVYNSDLGPIQNEKSDSSGISVIQNQLEIVACDKSVKEGKRQMNEVIVHDIYVQTDKVEIQFHSQCIQTDNNKVVHVDKESQTSQDNENNAPSTISFISYIS